MKMENSSTHLLFIKSKVLHNNSMMFLISRLTKKSLCHHQRMIDILNHHSNKMKKTKDYTRKVPIRKCQLVLGPKSISLMVWSIRVERLTIQQTCKRLSQMISMSKLAPEAQFHNHMMTDISKSPLKLMKWQTRLNNKILCKQRTTRRLKRSTNLMVWSIRMERHTIQPMDKKSFQILMISNIFNWRVQCLMPKMTDGTTKQS